MVSSCHIQSSYVSCKEICQPFAMPLSCQWKIPRHGYFWLKYEIVAIGFVQSEQACQWCIKTYICCNA